MNGPIFLKEPIDEGKEPFESGVTDEFKVRSDPTENSYFSNYNISTLKRLILEMTLVSCIKFVLVMKMKIGNLAGL